MLYRIETVILRKANRFNLREVSTNEIVFYSERRIDVLNKKKKLEAWKNKQKKRWNG